MKSYLELLDYVMTNGSDRSDRTGTGTLSVFGAQLRFSLNPTFPLLTTKKLHLRSIIYELLWFLKGDTNIKYLNDHKVSIWDEWADEEGNLGESMEHNGRIGQFTRRVTQSNRTSCRKLKNDPNSRRHIVCAWNPEKNQMALPPCHALFQFYVANGKLSCQLYQRSADLFLGVPFNIASYALLTQMIAKVCNLEAHEFVQPCDLHLYKNHLDQAKEQLSRTPRLNQLCISILS